MLSFIFIRKIPEKLHNHPNSGLAGKIQTNSITIKCNRKKIMHNLDYVIDYTKTCLTETLIQQSLDTGDQDTFLMPLKCSFKK